jgi:sulfide:quinone oxidoreductase
MSNDPAAAAPFEVVIAGGGVAGLEAALALRDLAGGRVRVTLLAPNSEFVYRAMRVREPFSFSRAPRYEVAQIAEDAGAELVVDALERVDVDARVVHSTTGRQLGYEALLLGLGAHIHARYEHAVTIDDERLDDLLHGLVQDIEDGYVRRLAFLVPAPMAWPLPVYELALMTARRAYDMNVELQVTILTPEDAPLALLGDGASSVVSKLLAESKIDVIPSAYCEVPEAGTILVSPGEQRLEVDRVVALPDLRGPAIPGLPADADGFIPIDEHCQVRDTERVYAAGDATDFPIKQGGIAAQQADAGAAAIAALAGAPVEAQPFHPAVRAVLLTGEQPRYFSAYITGGHGWGSEVDEEPWAAGHPKIAAKYLSPYLEARDRAAGGSAPG